MTSPALIEVMGKVACEIAVVRTYMSTSFHKEMISKGSKEYCILRRDCYPAPPTSRVVYPIYEISKETPYTIADEYTYKVAYLPETKEQSRICEEYHKTIKALRRAYERYLKPVGGIKAIQAKEKDNLILMLDPSTLKPEALAKYNEVKRFYA